MCIFTHTYILIEVVEGIYWPQALGKKAYNRFGGKTFWFLMMMMESIFGNETVLVLVSGFCVFKGIRFLIQRVIFGSSD